MVDWKVWEMSNLYTAVLACSVTFLQPEGIGIVLSMSHYYMESIRLESWLEYKLY
jgi:hypothetical protein